MKRLATILLVACLPGCSDAPTNAVQCESAANEMPPPGSNEVLRSPVSAGYGLEVIVSDVYLPPGVKVPRHYHPGEEFLYVIDGSAVHVEEGKPDQVLAVGDAYVIPPEAIHAPYGGPEGVRAVVFRLHARGTEERYLVPEDDT